MVEGKAAFRQRIIDEMFQKSQALGENGPRAVMFGLVTDVELEQRLVT